MNSKFSALTEKREKCRKIVWLTFEDEKIEVIDLK
jgi:hypothetical protein